MPVYKEFGLCKECKRNMLLFKGRCGTCWKKLEKQQVTEAELHET